MKLSRLYLLIGILTAWFVLTLTLILKNNYHGAIIPSFALFVSSIVTIINVVTK